LWGIEPEKELLGGIARDLGSDFPFFLSGGTAIGSGRGQVIDPTEDIVAKYLLIVSPDVSVSTSDAFRALNASALTSDGLERSLTVCRNEARSLDPLHSVLINDFEPTVFEAHPEIRRVRDTLLELGASNAALSGSGASVYAVFDKKETRQAAQKALDHESTWRKFAVSTISRLEYAKALGI
jgi:4-diphosphocytidyl-2C-methyl-D-erythritol kinase